MPYLVATAQKRLSLVKKRSTRLRLRQSCLERRQVYPVRHEFDIGAGAACGEVEPQASASDGSSWRIIMQSSDNFAEERRTNVNVPRRPSCPVGFAWFTPVILSPSEMAA
ncbi:hypothetical protein [Nitrobacter hamburgensis]|uniref:hypothetical protein n=1 Tax=Nitrobacter hamburgensis TaxID=912 RepID=UPI00059D798C|nr:hypothetical protein [Nitrobacter hamburgensis]